MYLLPSVTETLFTVRLPRGIRPRRVVAGYDAGPHDSYQSFLVVLSLDWSADAPRITRARLESLTAPMLPISHEQIRLAAGPPLSDPDVLDPDNEVLICDVTFTEPGAGALAVVYTRLEGK